MAISQREIKEAERLASDSIVGGVSKYIDLAIQIDNLGIGQVLGILDDTTSIIDFVPMVLGVRPKMQIDCWGGGGNECILIDRYLNTPSDRRMIADYPTKWASKYAKKILVSTRLDAAGLIPCPWIKFTPSLQEIIAFIREECIFTNTDMDILNNIEKLLPNLGDESPYKLYHKLKKAVNTGIDWHPLLTKYIHSEQLQIPPLEEHDNDYYPTPEMAIWPFLEKEEFVGTIWECACGDGAISRCLLKKYDQVISTDLIWRGYKGSISGVNFLQTNLRIDNIVTNPPYSLKDQFVEKALQLVRNKAAMLLPKGYLDAKKRKDFVKTITRIYNIGQPVNFSGKKVAACWCVWDQQHRNQETRWFNL